MLAIQKATVFAFLTMLISCNSDIKTPTQSSTPINEEPTASEVAADYTTYSKATDKEVLVNPELAMLCRGANEQDVVAARVKYGPHAHTSILVYMNDLAMAALDSGKGSYPVCSVVVKHKSFMKYLKDGKWVKDSENGVGGMIKRSPGYDSTHGDWEYFYFDDSTKVENGRIASCVQCHASNDAKDHVFASWRGK